MAKKVIEFDLSPESINQAIKQLKKEEAEFRKKCELVRERIAERIEELASVGFNSAQVDDVIKRGMRQASVDVKVRHGEGVSIIIAKGEDAVFVEFGAGVYHNGSAGTSPNPWGGDLGYTIGSYGQGKGKYKTWGYYDKNGKLVKTHGTPASMPMYNAAKQAALEAQKIIREVFR